MKINVGIDLSNTEPFMGLDAKMCQWLGVYTTAPGHELEIRINRLVWRANMWLRKWLGYRKTWELPYRWAIVDHNDPSEVITLDEANVRWPHYVPPELRQSVEKPAPSIDLFAEVPSLEDGTTTIQNYLEHLAKKGVIVVPPVEEPPAKHDHDTH